MIDTIFYFLNGTSADYQRLKSEISERTIVLCSLDRTIWRNNVCYGTMTEEEFKAMLNDLLHRYPNELLPIATKYSANPYKDHIGGMMAGKFFDITDDSPAGVLNINLNEFFSDSEVIDKIKAIIANSPDNLPVATDTQLGTVKIGDGLIMKNDPFGRPTKLSINDQYIKDIISVYNYSTIVSNIVKGIHASNTEYGTVKIKYDSDNLIEVADGIISVSKQKILSMIGTNTGGTTTTTYTLPAATSSTLGGIKVGYVQNGKNYPVQLDGLNQAYVNVPWIVSEGGSGGTGGNADTSNGGVQKMYFLNIAHGTTPNAPTIKRYNSSSNTFINSGLIWKYTNTNPTQNQDTWAIWVWFANEQPTAIQGPIKIYDSVNGGSNGEDTENIEWIYTRTEQKFAGAALDRMIAALAGYSSTEKITTSVTIEGVTWNNHPSGIDLLYKYEYTAFRVIGTTPFTGPILWSAYGDKGTDGDGVEYIFYKGTTLPGADDPTTWTSNADFKNDEYIPDGSSWVDDIDANTEMVAGEKIWVSIRRKRDGVWSAYSTPMVWAIYPVVEGAVVDGLITESSNDTMTVFLETEGGSIIANSNNNTMWEDTTHIDIYNGYNPISTFTLGTPNTSTDITVPSGKTNIFLGSNPSALVTVDNVNKNIKVTIVKLLFAEGYSTGDSIRIKVPITGITVNGASVSDRYVYVNILFAKVGADGTSYKLVPSSRVIKKTASGAIAHDLKVGVCATSGKQPESTEYFATGSGDIFGGFSVKFRIDDTGDWANYPFVNSSSNGWSSSYLLANVTSNVTVRLMYNDILVDQETIHVVQDGVGRDAVGYMITPIGTTILDTNGSVSGDVIFNVIKTEGSTRTYITDQNISSIGSLSLSWDGLHAQPAITYNPVTQQWSASITATTTYSYPAVVIYLNDLDSNILASAIIPVIKDPSSSGVQPLEAVVSRVSVWSPNGYEKSSLTYVNYNNGTVVESGDNLRYLDIVIYGNVLFCCDNVAATNTNPRVAPYNDANNTVNPGWIMLNNTLAEYIQNLVSDQAFISNLTVKNTVVTDSNNKVVAGMTSGSSVPTIVVDRNNNTPSNSNDVRIWAGEFTTDLNNAPFTVKGDGSVKATKFLAGDPEGVNITTTLDSIAFRYGNTTKAWFSTQAEDGTTPASNTLFLYITAPDGRLITIDFTNLGFKALGNISVITFYTLANNYGDNGTITAYTYMDGSTRLYCSQPNGGGLFTTQAGDNPKYLIVDDPGEYCIAYDGTSYRLYLYYILREVTLSNGEATFTGGKYIIAKDPTGSVNDDMYLEPTTMISKQTISNPNSTIYMGSSSTLVEDNGESEYQFSTNSIDAYVLNFSSTKPSAITLDCMTLFTHSASGLVGTDYGA